MTKLYYWLKENWSWFSYLILFLICFLIFSYLQYADAFADPDSFYHAKMSVLLRDEGVMEEFPWLQYTVLRDNFTNQHFLYHFSLIPWVTFFRPLIGIKLATVFLGSLLILVFYWFLRQMKVRWAFIYPLLLLTINPFVFRVSLAKAPGLSIIILLLGLYFIFSHKYKSLFVLSFLYVWFYGGFVLILFVNLCFLFVHFFYHRILKRLHYHRFIERLYAVVGRGRRFLENKKMYLKIFLASFLGVTGGVVINFYFPQNLKFYYNQLIKIGIINYKNIIGVGGEWYNYGFVELISNTITLSIILVVALVLFFIYFKKQSKLSLTTFIIFIFFFIFTLKSRRYVEYYVPFGMLFAAVTISDSLKRVNIKKFFNQFKKIYFRNIISKIIITLLILYILIIFPTVVIRDFKTAKNDLSGGISFDKFYYVSQWLKLNSEKGSIVIHSDWDDFPSLFYHNTHNYYIVGLDPTFMYEYNKDLYWKWVNLTTGKNVPDLYSVVKNEFKASYIIIEKDHTGMYNNVSSTSGFSLIYEDNQVYLYQVN